MREPTEQERALLDATIDLITTYEMHDIMSMFAGCLESMAHDKDTAPNTAVLALYWVNGIDGLLKNASEELSGILSRPILPG